MSVEREWVRELVREELVLRLAPPEEAAPSGRLRHPALLVVHLPEDDPRPLEAETPRPCVIEPDRPCYQSGYCKRLGY
jgi:hypothetical protein